MVVDPCRCRAVHVHGTGIIILTVDCFTPNTRIRQPCGALKTVLVVDRQYAAEPILIHMEIQTGIELLRPAVGKLQDFDHRLVYTNLLGI